MNSSQAQRPLVSVIIPTYNAAPYVRGCLESVYAQEGSFELDVIVVDDGSEDVTLAQIHGRFSVRSFTQPHRGPAAARNIGLDRARGEYIAYLDSDDLWPAGKLDRQLALMRANPDVGLVFGDCRQFDHDGPFNRTLFEEQERTVGTWGDPVLVENPYARLLEDNFITTGTVVMRRWCVDAVGRFDEGLRLVEDLDYWLRVALACPIAHLDSVCLLRRRHGRNASRDPVAMSLAFLDVLANHRRRYGAEDRILAANLVKALAREYLELGHLYTLRHDERRAVAAFARSLRARPTARSVYYLLRSLMSQSGFVRRK